MSVARFVRAPKPSDLWQEACMVWELGMEDLSVLLFTHPKLKEQMLEGFHEAIRRRMQNNPRARWLVMLLLERKAVGSSSFVGWQRDGLSEAKILVCVTEPLHMSKPQDSLCTSNVIPGCRAVGFVWLGLTCNEELCMPCSSFIFIIWLMNSLASDGGWCCVRYFHIVYRRSAETHL